VRTRPVDALARPAMPAAPSATPTPARTTKRVTLDLDHADHRALRLWALDAELDASLLLRALLALAEADPAIRSRAEALAEALAGARRGGDR